MTVAAGGMQAQVSRLAAELGVPGVAAAVLAPQQRSRGQHLHRNRPRPAGVGARAQRRAALMT